METLIIAVASGVAFLVAYHTYGKWLGGKIFNLSIDFVCPSHRLRDDKDYIPTSKPVVFGHHFTSIAGTGPIVGPAIAVMWGWLPALLWVVFGSIFIGAVHDFGALVVSLRNNGQTVGDVAGRVLNRRVRLLFLIILFMALTIVLAIFGLVIAAVFKKYPSSIFPCLIQIPIAVGIGLYLHRKGVGLLLPSLLALATMYVTVIFGDVGFLGAFNGWAASLSIITWVIILLVYSYVASVLPVWTLLQPRDYINSLQLISALALIVIGLFTAAIMNGAPPVEGAERPVLEIVAPTWDFKPAEAPLILPFLFITIACGAISGFHCLVSSGTSSKQLDKEPDARFVGYGGMLTEGFLATLVILACVAGLGLGVPLKNGSFHGGDGAQYELVEKGDPDAGVLAIKPLNADDAAGNFRLAQDQPGAFAHNAELGVMIGDNGAALVGAAAWKTRYSSWSAAGGLGAKVGAFVDGSANFLKSMGIPAGIAIALMGVLVASFAGTTLDTACRLQRYVVQELAATFLPRFKPNISCAQCEYDLTDNVSGNCPECGKSVEDSRAEWAKQKSEYADRITGNPFTWLRNKHGATIFAIFVATVIAAMPKAGTEWGWANAGKGGLNLWPLFGATNQLLAGLSFLVITFYLWRRSKPIFFLVLPLLLMLLMPAWAMIYQLFIKGVGMQTSWLGAESPNYPVIVIGFATLALEVWMIIEAIAIMPKVKGVLESALGSEPEAAVAGPDGMNC